LISSIDDIGSEGRYLALQIFVKHDSYYSDAKDIVETMMTNNEINDVGYYAERTNQNNVDIRKIIFWSFASSGIWEMAIPDATQLFIDYHDIDDEYFRTDKEQNRLRQLAIQVFLNAKEEEKDRETNIQHALALFQPVRDLPMINDILKVIIRKGTTRVFEILWDKLQIIIVYRRIWTRYLEACV
jgi:hypothetical protein